MCIRDRGEEEFRAAENLKAQYPDKIVTATYPDNFQKETETTISNILNLVADPQVKGLVLCQAVPGGAAAVAQAREINPDLVVTFGVMQEDPNVTNGAAEAVSYTHLDVYKRQAWLEIPGIDFSYPVVQGQDNDYYLRNNFYKEPEVHGTPFVDYRNDLKEEENLIVYCLLYTS